MANPNEVYEARLQMLRVLLNSLTKAIERGDTAKADRLRLKVLKLNKKLELSIHN